MQAHACQKNIPIVFLSPSRITQLAIHGHDIPDDHPDLVNMNRLDIVNHKIRLHDEQYEEAANYMYKVMKIAGGRCILAAHRIG